jgi:endo-1,4-beta-D-glucanase Y
VFLAAAGLGPASPALAGEDDRAAWEAFKSRFLQPDGRIVDTGNKGVSHTEGQGWGMVFAERFGERQVFDSIWGWTDRNLRRPHDALHSWRFDPNSGTPVADTNNATDGDLFIAMALSRAARRWGDAAHSGAASAIGRDILRLLVHKVGARTVLLPAAAGFRNATEVVINPSYYAFTAIRELAKRFPAPEWGPLQRDGAALIAQGRFGRWKLPPDWLQLELASGGLLPAQRWPPRFSYDAIRVPLYLAWAGLPLDGGFMEYAADFHDRLPAWVDLTTNETAPYGASPGMLATMLAAQPRAARELPADFPPLSASQDYYSAALTMLARLVWREMQT